MSIVELKPCDLPGELRARIEKVMENREIDWDQAIIFLAQEVVSPSDTDLSS